MSRNDEHPGAGPTAPDSPASPDTRLIDAFLDSLWAERGIAPATAEAYRHDLAGFLARVSAPVEQLTRAD
ncbi:MAG: site-specific integrase, partial [Wenzhouxiangella sp.]|nr:site-specific integrase [Wenzhouxiangella sp.]